LLIPRGAEIWKISMLPLLRISVQELEELRTISDSSILKERVENGARKR